MNNFFELLHLLEGAGIDHHYDVFFRRIDIAIPKRVLIVTCKNGLFAIREQYSNDEPEHADGPEEALEIIRTHLKKYVPEDDPVNHPKHYNVGGIETIALIQTQLTREEFRGYLKGNILKYRERHPYKGNPKQDLAKAKWYFDKLQEVGE